MDLAPGIYLDRQGFARYPRLVHRGPSGYDGSVDRDATPGKHHHQLSRCHLIQRNRGHGVTIADLYGIREEGHQVCKGVPAAVHRQVLKEFGGQDEGRDHQRCDQLTNYSRRDDSYEHRQLHAHSQVPDVLPGLRENGPAADAEPQPRYPRAGETRNRERGAEGHDQGTEQVCPVDAGPQTSSRAGGEGGHFLS